ncbi:unnamed protein product [Mytilus coruscus]|uniref:Cysteine and tyrosine-rich protein 1 n=1 Tax=Mytilus coruscus TaxID=42192 RepID=A0A6J8AH23_MYTCO|nr:unnamed protein product [Mytilus coruscus]
MEKWLNFLLFSFNIGSVLSDCCNKYTYQYSYYYCAYCDGYCYGPSSNEYCDSYYSNYYYYYSYYSYAAIGPFSVGAFVGLIIGSIIFLVFVIGVIVAICASCTKTAGQRGRVVHPNNGIAVIHSNTNIAGQHMYATPSAPPPYMFSNGGYGMGYHTSSVLMPPPPPSYAVLDQTRPPPPPTYSSLNSTIPPPTLPPIQHRNN